MSMDFLNQLLFPVFTFFILISIIGYGLLFSTFIPINNIELNLKNILFIKGLLILGFFLIFINLITPITNSISLFVILTGSIIYLFSFFKNTKKKEETVFIIFVVILSFIYAFYAGVSDDFNYHYETIQNFKNKDLFSILHERRISYNSHWLFLTSIFSLTYFTSTLFILTALFFCISIYDFFILFRKSLKEKKFYVSVLSFFSLIFFLGVFNQFKDLGTDFPGVILSIYVLLIVTYYIFDSKKGELYNIFLYIFSLCQFALIIKITNALLYFYLFFILFKLKIKKINYWLLLITCLIPLPWIYQNYIISGCLVWPISATCFSNREFAINEAYLIESFAKGDITTSMNVNGLSWIYTWLTNHSNKIIETYLVYLLILLLPFIWITLKNINKLNFIINYLKEKYSNTNYKVIVFIIVFSNIIWFFYAPAYRFGVSYNLSLLIIILLPMWLYMINFQMKFILSYSKIILIIVCIYFLIENIIRIDWYIKRYDMWPPIKQGELLKRKNF